MKKVETGPRGELPRRRGQRFRKQQVDPQVEVVVAVDLHLEPRAERELSANLGKEEGGEHLDHPEGIGSFHAGVFEHDAGPFHVEGMEPMLPDRRLTRSTGAAQPVEGMGPPTADQRISAR